MEGTTFVQGYGNGLPQYGLIEGKIYSMNNDAEDPVKDVFGHAEAKVYFVEGIPQYSFNPDGQAK